MDSTDYFMKKFNIPKPNLPAPGIIPNPEALKEYEDMCLTFIKFFEDLSGRRVHAEKCIENLVYFFDQGFEIDHMIDYVRAQQRSEFFLTNPDVFTIKHLFPIKDPDRCNAVWDKLSYFQSLRKNTEKIVSIKHKTLKCGHKSDGDGYSCLACIQNGDEYEIMKDPYSPGVPDFQIALANHFKRSGNETLEQYARRTFELRKEINSKRKIKITEAHFEVVSNL